MTSEKTQLLDAEKGEQWQKRTESDTRPWYRKVDISLIIVIVVWYWLNAQYNIWNKKVLERTQGAQGIPLTMASIQMLIGIMYGVGLWVAPDARPTPKTTIRDIIAMIPLSIFFAGAHLASTFALSAGSVSFGQIVKASEPAFAAMLGTIFYSKKVSFGKWLCLIPIIGGVCMASIGELGSVTFLGLLPALMTGLIGNMFAAFKANENKQCMDTAGLKERIGSVGNQFAITVILAWIFSSPIVLYFEYSKRHILINAWQESPEFRWTLVGAGLSLYVFNELATVFVKKTNAVTQSVANTAKRAIVIIGCAFVFGECMDTLKIAGSGIAIGGVFLYSVIDDLCPTSKTQIKTDSFRGDGPIAIALYPASPDTNDPCSPQIWS